MLVGAGLFLYHQTRGTTLWFDDWGWALHRRGGSVGTYLDPNNEHLSLVPVAIYKLLFATAGTGDYAPYRVVVIVAHLLCGALLFVYARPRSGWLLGLIAAALIVFLGPGWQNFLWPFQMAWLISIAAGIGALLAIDRGGRRGDLAACALIAVSLASSGIGVPFALGLIVDIALARGRRQARWWVVASPLALYALWWLGYQHAQFHRHFVVLTPAFVARAAASSLSALAGLGGDVVPSSPGTLETWGPPLLVAAVAAAGWRLVRLRAIPGRVLTLATVALSFWILTALARATLVAPFASRYLYVGAVLVVLLAVELCRGIRPGRWAGAVLAVLAAGALLSNFDTLRAGASFLRFEGQVTVADLDALEIGRPVVSSGYVAAHLPGYPFVILSEGGYLAMTRAIGSPRAGAPALPALTEGARVQADAELIAMHGAGLVPGPGPSGPGLPPATASGVCQTLIPPQVTAPAAPPAELTVKLPAAGLSIRAGGAQAAVSVRRFAAEFQPIGTVSPGGAASLRIGPDLSSQPWSVQVASSARVSVCPLSR
jgi:hypothetical protein